MEKEMAVWLDSEKAFLISFTETGESISKIESEIEHRVRFRGEKKGFHRLGGMLSNPDKVITERRKHQLTSYFQKVITNLHDADKILLFGPSKTKDWLGKEIRKDHGLCEKLLGVEKADSITENQMIAKAKEFFEEHRKNPGSKRRK